MQEREMHAQVNNEGRHAEEGEVAASPPQTGSSKPAVQAESWPTTPTVLTWQDLADLPRQILPEQTYRHLQNARAETALALFSLWKNFNKSRQAAAGQAGQPRRKRIEVE